MRLRSILVAIVAIVYLVQPVRADNEEWPEHVRTPRAETLRAAVAEWCDEHIGYFILNKGHPVCLLRSEVRKWFFFGEWRMVERRYWWSRRKDETTGRRVAILWLVEPNGYPPIEPDNEGRETVPPGGASGYRVFVRSGSGGQPGTGARCSGRTGCLPMRNRCLGGRTLAADPEISPGRCHGRGSTHEKEVSHEQTSFHGDSRRRVRFNVKAILHGACRHGSSGSRRSSRRSPSAAALFVDSGSG